MITAFIITMYEFLYRFKYIYCKILCYVLCKSIFVFITCAICWFQKDLVGQRGLLPNTEQQTFVMTLPRKLRLKYEEVLLAVALEVHTKILSVLCPTYNMNLRPISGMIILDVFFFRVLQGLKQGKRKVDSLKNKWRPTISSINSCPPLLIM